VKYDRRHRVKELLFALTPCLLECGIDYPVFSEIAKLAYAFVGSKRTRFRNGRPNHALLSAETGINRRELRQLLNISKEQKSPSGRNSLAEKLRTTWHKDSRFVSKNGAPRKLRIDDDTNGFSALTRVIASDLPPSAILSYAIKKQVVRCTGTFVEIHRQDKLQNRVRQSDPIAEFLHQIEMLISQAQAPHNLLRTNQRRSILCVNNHAEARYLLREAEDSARRTLDGLTLTKKQPTAKKRTANRYSINVTISTTLSKMEEQSKQS
jgi:Family of unknown function (DUF6502)